VECSIFMYVGILSLIVQSIGQAERRELESSTMHILPDDTFSAGRGMEGIALLSCGEVIDSVESAATTGPT
jgi:hypothetical protein